MTSKPTNLIVQLELPKYVVGETAVIVAPSRPSWRGRGRRGVVAVVAPSWPSWRRRGRRGAARARSGALARVHF